MNADFDGKAEVDTSAEFAAAFAEASQTDQEPSSQSAQDGTGSREAEAAGDKPASEQEGAPEAGSREADDANTNAPSPSGNPTDTDIWASAPEPLRAQFESMKREFEHKLTSANGRVSGLQKQLDAARKAQQTDKEPEPDPRKLLDSDEVKKVREDYGEIAEPILKVVQPLVDKITQLEGSASSAETERQQLHEARVQAAVEQAHPDWLQVLGSNQGTFTSWIENQPRYVQQAFERNKDGWSDPDEAIDIIGRFKGHLATLVDPQTQDIGAKRERQLDAGQSVRAKAPSASSQEPDDFAAGFMASSRA